MFAVTPSTMEKQHERNMFSVYWPFSCSGWEREVGVRHTSPVQQYLCHKECCVSDAD